LIVACVFVAAGMCLPIRDLAIDVWSGSAIPAFRRHVTVCFIFHSMHISATSLTLRYVRFSLCSLWRLLSPGIWSHAEFSVINMGVRRSSERSIKLHGVTYQKTVITDLTHTWCCEAHRMWVRNSPRLVKYSPYGKKSQLKPSWSVCVMFLCRIRRASAEIINRVSFNFRVRYGLYWINRNPKLDLWNLNFV
jgi:hypothetical protein